MSDLIKYGPETAQIIQIVKNVIRISRKIQICPEILIRFSIAGNGFGNYWHHFTH